MTQGPVGIVFKETMAGGFHLGAREPEEGERLGKEAGTTLSLHSTVSIGDLKRFIAEADHAGGIGGTVDFRPLGQGLPTVSGVFNLFNPSGDPEVKLMVYEVGFRAQGKDYYLAGQKDVAAHSFTQAWRDTTTLYTRLYEGRDKGGRVVGAGILSLDVAQLVAMCVGMKVVGASTAAETAGALAEFGHFFMGELWDTYVVPSAKSKAASAPPTPAREDARYDVIVIGSGFGGAVSACRLSEQGRRVLVLERGRRWAKDEYPRKPGDAWVFDPERPEHRNGWLDFRVFKGMSVAQGAGVGGGSLIYANISVEAPRSVFASGWPPEITYDGLKRYYDRVADFMAVGPVPGGQLPARTLLMREGAAKLGALDRFQMLPLAVTFDPAWHYGLKDARTDFHSKTVTNKQGQAQGTCVHCGNCDIGCQVHAKNTLDLNYLAWAERHGCEIRPLSLVRSVRPQGNGYRVDFERIGGGRREPDHAFADKVILAAGSLGSTELLLRCRDEYRCLPRVSARLGADWSSNGDFLTPAFYRDRKVSPNWGPTITSAIDFLDGSRDGQKFYIEDGGFPDLLANYLKSVVGRKHRDPAIQALCLELGRRLSHSDPLDNAMPWFAQGIDAGDGRLTLKAPWYWPFGRKRLRLKWDYRRSEGLIQAIVETHKALAKATGGEPWVPPTWSAFRGLVTPHPLGGCGMGSDPSTGVVDHRGEVFGHPGLFVLDGSIVPAAVGRNPSRTIAALAERAVELMR